MKTPGSAINREDFPLVMDAKDLQRIFPSRTVVYKLMALEGIPIIRVGRRKYINRDLFFRWLDSRSTGFECMKPCSRSSPQ